MEKKEILIDGLRVRHVAQIVRRKTTTQSVPSGKLYKRNEKHRNKDF